MKPAVVVLDCRRCSTSSTRRCKMIDAGEARLRGEGTELWLRGLQPGGCCAVVRKAKLWRSECSFNVAEARENL